MSKTRKKPANYSLSRRARWYAVRLQKPLSEDSESAVVEHLILQEADRLGLTTKKRTNGQSTGKAVAA